jgi:hypothetical protein
MLYIPNPLNRLKLLIDNKKFIFDDSTENLLILLFKDKFENLYKVTDIYNIRVELIKFIKNKDNLDEILNIMIDWYMIYPLNTEISWKLNQTLYVGTQNIIQIILRKSIDKAKNDGRNNVTLLDISYIFLNL